MATSETLQTALNRANPNTLADVLALVDLGTILAPTTKTITQAAASTMTLTPPALCAGVCSVRVTTGVAPGIRQVTDAGGTPSTTVCTLSADGTTLTFEANVQVATVSYVPRPATDMSTAWASL